MRREFFDTKEKAMNCLWACIIFPADGGFVAFESSADFDLWWGQI